MRFWLISPFDSRESDFSRVWKYDVDNNIVAIGWDKLRNPSKFASVNQIKNRLLESYPNEKKQFNKIAEMIWDFYHEVKPNDIILARRGVKNLIGIGIVKSEAYYDKEKGIKIANTEEGYSPNFIDIEWTELKIELGKPELSRYTLKEFTEEEFQKYFSLITSKNIRNTWLIEIFIAISKLGGIVDRKDLNEYIEKTTKRELAESWEQITNKIIRIHSSDSNDSDYTGKDYFEKTGELGDGVWGIRNQPVEDDYIAPDSEDHAKKWKEDKVRRVIRDTKKTKKLKSIYSNTCQICDKTIALKKSDYSEVHHIKPLGKKHDGPDTFDNMIVLCPNHHVEFDYGVIALDPQTLEVIHKNNNNPFIDKKIKLKGNHKLKKEFLTYHLKNIYD